MRELQLWDSTEALKDAFEDIDTLAAECRFRDCAHEREPVCAVRAAVDDGRLAASRLDNYHRLQREGDLLRRRDGRTTPLRHPYAVYVGGGAACARRAGGR